MGPLTEVAYQISSWSRVDWPLWGVCITCDNIPSTVIVGSIPESDLHEKPGVCLARSRTFLPFRSTQGRPSFFGVHVSLFFSFSFKCWMLLFVLKLLGCQHFFLLRKVRGEMLPFIVNVEKYTRLLNRKKFWPQNVRAVPVKHMWYGGKALLFFTYGWLSKFGQTKWNI